VVVPGDALELLEDLRPFVSALVIDAVELFVQDRLNTLLLLSAFAY
jgi:hypothetical protein